MPADRIGTGASSLHEPHSCDKVLLCCGPYIWLPERLQQVTGCYVYLSLDTLAFLCVQP